jgi:hypothetical protein
VPKIFFQKKVFFFPEALNLNGMKTTIFRVFCAFAVFLAGGVILSAQMTPAGIEITYVKGAVEIIDNVGGEGRAKVGKIFQAGTQIVTSAKGHLKLVFANGTRMVVEPDTNVRIEVFNMVKNAKTLESGFTRLSTIKEPTNSVTQIFLVKGNLLFEVAPLNYPVSSFRLSCPYFGAIVKGTVFRFEQGIDFGRMSVYKGLVRSTPYYKEFGPDIDVPAGKMVFYRFRHKPLFDNIRDPREEQDAGNELIDPPPGFIDPEDGGDGTLVVPDPPRGVDPEGPLDVTLIEDPSEIAPAISKRLGNQ